jgi:hypothetical protein
LKAGIFRYYAYYLTNQDAANPQDLTISVTKQFGDPDLFVGVFRMFDCFVLRFLFVWCVCVCLFVW